MADRPPPISEENNIQSWFNLGSLWWKWVPGPGSFIAFQINLTKQSCNPNSSSCGVLPQSSHYVRELSKITLCPSGCHSLHYIKPEVNSKVAWKQCSKNGWKILFFFVPLKQLLIFTQQRPVSDCFHIKGQSKLSNSKQLMKKISKKNEALEHSSDFTEWHRGFSLPRSLLANLRHHLWLCYIEAGRGTIRGGSGCDSLQSTVKISDSIQTA